LKSSGLLAYRFRMAEPAIPSPIRELISTPEPPDLGPGPRPGVEPLAVLSGRINDALNQAALTGSRGELVRAIVLLWHDHFAAAHAIAQEIETRDGSYVHAILHRREPDYGNAKYWFHRVGRHPSFPELAARASALLKSAGDSALERQLVRHGQWEATALVDACEALAGQPADHRQVHLLREIQRAEFEVLLNHLASGK
jgi:hypothetical protein